jgi:hypothetical protein
MSLKSTRRKEQLYVIQFTEEHMFFVDSEALKEQLGAGINLLMKDYLDDIGITIIWEIRKYTCSYQEKLFR